MNNTQETRGGLWFTNHGVGFPFEDRDYAPFYALAAISRSVVTHYPRLVEWIADNPCNAANDDGRLDWYRSLAEEFCQCGWHLLWNGVLFSQSSVENVRGDLLQLEPETLGDLRQWSRDAVVDVHPGLGAEKSSELLWGDLYSVGSNPEVNETGEPPPLPAGISRVNESVSPVETSKAKSAHSMIRTYSLHDISVTLGDGQQMQMGRPLVVTVGSQALEPNVDAGKTLLRFLVDANSPLLESAPIMKVKVCAADGSTVFHQASSVELIFDNRSFLSRKNDMPLWLVESLEFAAARLREQYRLNQEGGLDIETLES